MSNLFRKKSIELIRADAAAGLGDHEGEGATGLRKSLGLLDLTGMGIAAIIGAGIFAMIGNASANGGPAVIFLFIFTAFACAFSALCYAEFASKVPIAGSAYTYSYASFGELFAWIIGWDLIVEYAIGNIAVAISWSDYFTSLLAANGVNIPAHLTMDYLSASRGFDKVQGFLSGGATLESLKTNPDVTAGMMDAYNAWQNAPKLGGLRVICDLPALAIVLLITALVYIGIRESKRASNVMVALKLGIILLVIVLGAFYVQPANWSPFAPNGFAGVMKGVAAVFFAYIGFDALSTTAEECVNPKRDLPRAMIYSLVICTVLYVILALVLTGMKSYKDLGVGDPLAYVFGPEGANLPWVAGIISVGAVIAMATVLLVFQLGQPRIWMAMSRDGLLPPAFSRIHPKFQTPYIATIVTGLLVAIPALFMNLTEVTDLSSIGTLFAFVLVSGGVLMKDKEFGAENRYVPYFNSQFIVPVLFVVVCGLLYKYNGDNLKAFFGNLAYDPKTGEQGLAVFQHKIPYLVYIVFAALLTILCFVKKLSLIPALGLLSCGYLMTELGITNWIRFGVWLLIGLVLYFAYGYSHSKLDKTTVEA
jgi:amino acid transporter